MTPRRAPLAVLALVLLVALGAGGGSSASALQVHAGTVGAQVLGRCQEGAVAVVAALRPATTSVTSVTVSGLDPVACAGRSLQVELADTSAGSSWAGDVRVSATSTVSASSVTLATAAFVPTSALVPRVRIDGWTVPSTWTLTAGGLQCVDASGGGASCTVVVDRYQQWNGGYRLDFHVTSTALLPFRYEVRVDLSSTGLDLGGARGFPGWPVPASAGHPSWYPAGVSLTNDCVASGAADLPALRLRGSGVGWNDYVAFWLPATSLGFQVADNLTFPSGAACQY